MFDWRQWLGCGFLNLESLHLPPRIRQSAQTLPRERVNISQSCRLGCRARYAFMFRSDRDLRITICLTGSPDRQGTSLETLLSQDASQGSYRSSVSLPSPKPSSSGSTAQVRSTLHIISVSLQRCVVARCFFDDRAWLHASREFISARQGPALGSKRPWSWTVIPYCM